MIDPYSFVMRGELAQEAIDKVTAKARNDDDELPNKIAMALPFDSLDKDLLVNARKMAIIYSAIAAFENSARKFIQDRLLEQHGANWWDTKVPNGIQTQAQKRKDEEEANRYHGARGTSMIYYAQIGDLTSIIQTNFQDSFEDYIPSIEWARQIFQAIERSRNVIMHSGDLSMNDIQRVGMNIRDWLQQVG